MQLRQTGIQTPLLILGPVQPSDYERAAKHGVTLTVSSLEEARAVAACAQTLGKKITVHFALDTGMSRIGFPCTEAAAEEIREAAVKIFKAVDGQGLSRVDFFLENETNRVIFNEINTLPGFTSISMYPMLWGAKGIDKPELIERLIQLAHVREIEL